MVVIVITMILIIMMITIIFIIVIISIILLRTLRETAAPEQELLSTGYLGLLQILGCMALRV